MQPRIIRRVIVATVFACLLGIGMTGASAAPPYDNWDASCGTGTHVAYNPITGNSMRVAFVPQLTPGGVSYWNVWQCFDSGGIAGYSVGTALYPNGSLANGFVEHTPVCLPHAPTCDIQLWTGATLGGPTAGAVGARPCAIFSVTPHATPTCVSVGATPGSGTSVTHGNPAPGAICGISVAGTCAVQQVTVQTGGTLATVYVDTTPVPVVVPTNCVGVNRPSLTVVNVVPGGTSC